MFAEYPRLKNRVASLPKLLLLGSETLAVPFHDDIIYLGFVSEAEKASAMASCDWVLLPSAYESLSLTLLETWAAGRPGLVSGRSEVLKGHCRRAHGGLWFDTWDEVAAIISKVDAPTMAQLGRNGLQYVQRYYSWARTKTAYLEVLGLAEKARKMGGGPLSPAS